MAGRRICYALALMGSAVFYLMYQQWFSWMVLLTMLGLPFFSLLISLRAMLCLRVKLDAPERVTAGTAASVRLQAHAPGVRPPLRCKIRVTKPITGESWILHSGDRLPTEHTGGLTLRTERAKVYDYLGLFCLKLRRPPAAVVRVMPPEENLPIPEEITRVLAHAWKPKPGGGYAENHEIRPFIPGDALNLIHWKLSAKADSLMLREPMEPDQGILLLSVDINGSPAELDRKFARLLCYGRHLLRHGVTFELLALTEKGIESFLIREESAWRACVDGLLCASFAPSGTLRERSRKAPWQYHIGGEPDEA